MASQILIHRKVLDCMFKNVARHINGLYCNVKKIFVRIVFLLYDVDLHYFAEKLPKENENILKYYIDNIYIYECILQIIYWPFYLLNMHYINTSRQCSIILNANAIVTKRKIYEMSIALHQLVYDNTEVVSCAFNNCFNMQFVFLMPSVKDIHQYAFANCINLRAIYIPKTIEHICSDAFANCISLSSVVFY